MRPARLPDRTRAAVDALPPLTEDQRARLARTLRAATGRAS